MSDAKTGYIAGGDNGVGANSQKRHTTFISRLDIDAPSLRYQTAIFSCAPYLCVYL